MRGFHMLMDGQQHIDWHTAKCAFMGYSEPWTMASFEFIGGFFFFWHALHIIDNMLTCDLSY
jgi:hypothetical protein